MVNLSKLLATLAIWAAVAMISIVALSNSMFIDEAWVMIPLVGVPVSLGFVVTLAIWAPAVFPWVDAGRLRAINDDRQVQTEAASEKRKRSEGSSSGDERIDMLMRMMTPDEREDFKQALKQRVLNDLSVGDDGELTSRRESLANLLDDESERRQNRR